MNQTNDNEKCTGPVVKICQFLSFVERPFLILTATNPVYERGASDTLKMAKISNGNGPAEEEWPDYQPLVENSKPRDRKDSLPGYRALSTGQRPPNQQATSDRGIRSSNYLSLIKDDPEEGREYQTLMKDGNPQVTSKVFDKV